jgi:hypothetical protein
VIRAKCEREARGERQFEDEAAAECSATPGSAPAVGEPDARVSESTQVQAPETDRKDLRLQREIVARERVVVGTGGSREGPAEKNADAMMGEVAEL